MSNFVTRTWISRDPVLFYTCEPTRPALSHSCGWLGGPGSGVPCADPITGPFFCPRCGGELETE